MHEAIKMMNGMMGKGSIDMQDRSEIIKAEYKLLENQLQAQINDLKKSLKNKDENSEERL